MKTIAAGGVAALIIAVIGLILWERAPYNTESAPFDNAVWYGYNPPGIQGIMMFLTLATLAVVLLFEAIDACLHRAWTAGTLQDKHVALALHAVCGIVLIGTAIAALVAWASPVLACGVVLCVDPSVYNNWPAIRGDSFNVCIALAVGIAFVSLGVLLLWRSICWIRLLSRREGDTSVPTQTRLFVSSWSRPLVKLVVMLMALAVLFFLAGYLPNDARRWTPAFMAGYASLETSRDGSGYSYVFPELKNAWMRSTNILMGHGWVIKVYPSNVIFYSSVALLLVLAFLVQRSRKLTFYSRIRIRLIPQFSVGDVTLFCLCLIVFGLFFFYWLHDHNFKGLWSPSTPTAQMNLSERWARALGQLGVIIFAFLMVPAPRYSIVYEVFGLSRESLLWLHRWFGYGMIAVTVGHIIAYLVYFYEAGTLQHNLFHIPTLIGEVRNDLTVILITWATLILYIAMGVLALNVVRRACYELFYYAHLVSSYLMIPALLWHAHSAWMYVLPAVSLWFVDQIVRVWQRAGRATIVNVRTVGDDVVELVCDLRGNRHLSRVHPGQYVYLNIPEISILQWHPFTLTSVDPAIEGQSSPLVMHIKSMGEKSWTGKLYSMVNLKQAITVRLEGPCGIPLDFRHYERVCLIGGGIGVVPCASIYGSLRRAHATDSGGAYSAQRVQVLWATRSASLAAAMGNYMDLPPSWAGLDGRDGNGAQFPPPPPLDLTCEQAARFRCGLFVTNRDAFDSLRRCESVPSQRDAAKQSLVHLGDNTAADTTAVFCTPHESGDVCQSCLTFEKQVAVHCHRPNLAEEVSCFFSNSRSNAPVNGTNLTNNNNSSDGNVKSLLFVCGPEALVNEVGRIGAELGIPVHQEEFLF